MGHGVGISSSESSPRHAPPGAGRLWPLSCGDGLATPTGNTSQIYARTFKRQIRYLRDGHQMKSPNPVAVTLTCVSYGACSQIGEGTCKKLAVKTGSARCFSPYLLAEVEAWRVRTYRR
jgi:hypothetical protein